MKALASLILFSFVLVACAHKQTAGGPVRKFASALEVVYLPESEDDYTQLAMEPVVPGKKTFEMELFAVNPSNAHMCEYSGVFTMKEDQLTFVNKTDACTVTVRFDSKKYLKAEIVQQGQDFECGCGANVYLDGRVKVKRRGP